MCSKSTESVLTQFNRGCPWLALQVIRTTVRSGAGLGFGVQWNGPRGPCSGGRRKSGRAKFDRREESHQFKVQVPRLRVALAVWWVTEDLPSCTAWET